MSIPPTENINPSTSTRVAGHVYHESNPDALADTVGKITCVFAITFASLYLFTALVPTVLPILPILIVGGVGIAIAYACMQESCYWDFSPPITHYTVAPYRPTVYSPLVFHYPGPIVASPQNFPPAHPPGGPLVFSNNAPHYPVGVRGREPFQSLSNAHQESPPTMNSNGHYAVGTRRS